MVIVTKAHELIHINLLLTESKQTKDVEIVRAES